jgi:hypothetical protein
MAYIVLEPIDQPVQTTFTLAPRPASLSGLTVGLIDNGKRNSDYVLKKITARIQERYPDISLEYVRKPSASHGIPEEMARDLAAKAQAVIAGIGD